MRPWHLFLRALQLIFATIVMAMVGDMLNSYRDHSQATVNYVMFTSAFALATLFYLIASELSEKFEVHPLLRFIIDLLNTLFLFAAAVALPSKLHVPDCDNHDKLRHNSITKDSNSLSKTCREAKAATAFLWFAWFAFLISTILSGIRMTGGWMGFGRRAHRRSSRVGPQQSMAQV